MITTRRCWSEIDELTLIDPPPESPRVCGSSRLLHIIDDPVEGQKEAMILLFQPQKRDAIQQISSSCFFSRETSHRNSLNCGVWWLFDFFCFALLLAAITRLRLCCYLSVPKQIYVLFSAIMLKFFGGDCRMHF